MEPDSQESAPLMDVYFDQAAPGVEDWTAIHEPYLKRARAIIVICTPGSKLNEGTGDWVHKEIDWWLGNRVMAPILVDPLGEEMRYVPDPIANRWPNAQRIRLIEKDWEGLAEDDRQVLDDRVRAQFLGAIVPSGDSFYRQELEQEKERTARMQRTRNVVIILSAALLSVLLLASWSYSLKNKADLATLDAEAARRAMETAYRLAQARVTEGQAARATIESRLINYLQQFKKFEGYKPYLEQWEAEFSSRAAELNRKARAELPHCTQADSASVYEGQMVEIYLDNIPEHEALYVYLSSVPGSSPRPGDWAPAVFDVFFGDKRKVKIGRNLKRKDVKEQMASVSSENKWGLLMGLGTPHLVTHRERNYRLTQKKVYMNDEGDMAMTFEICLEAEMGGE